MKGIADEVGLLVVKAAGTADLILAGEALQMER
jgi:hypothetical protein